MSSQEERPLNTPGTLDILPLSTICGMMRQTLRNTKEPLSEESLLATVERRVRELGHRLQSRDLLRLYLFEVVRADAAFECRRPDGSDFAFSTNENWPSRYGAELVLHIESRQITGPVAIPLEYAEEIRFRVRLLYHECTCRYNDSGRRNWPFLDARDGYGALFPVMDELDWDRLSCGSLDPRDARFRNPAKPISADHASRLVTAMRLIAGDCLEKLRACGERATAVGAARYWVREVMNGATGFNHAAGEGSLSPRQRRAICDGILEAWRGHHISITARCDAGCLPDAKRACEAIQAALEDLGRFASEYRDGNDAKLRNERATLCLAMAATWPALEELAFVQPAPVSEELSPTLNELTDRQRDVLRVLYEEKAFDRESRMRIEDVAIKAEGPMANANGFKGHCAGLSVLGLLDSTLGRGGGIWLTSVGRRLAARLCDDQTDAGIDAA